MEFHVLLSLNTATVCNFNTVCEAVKHGFFGEFLNASAGKVKPLSRRKNSIEI
jgi:hypothetical protein